MFTRGAVANRHRSVESWFLETKDPLSLGITYVIESFKLEKRVATLEVLCAINIRGYGIVTVRISDADASKVDSIHRLIRKFHEHSVVQQLIQDCGG